MYRLILTLGLLALSACSPTATRFLAASEQEVRAETLLQKKLVSEERVKSRMDHQERLLRVSRRVLSAGAGLCGMLKDLDQICDYRVEISDDAEINAFADGEKILVTPAMMEFAKSDNELGIVLSHEFAHNLMGHPGSKKTNAIIGAILGAIVDGLAGSNEGNVSRLGAQIGAGAYSHSTEFEADYIGLYITARAGLDIRDAANFWRRMSAAASVSSVGTSPAQASTTSGSCP